MSRTLERLPLRVFTRRVQIGRTMDGSRFFFLPQEGCANVHRGVCSLRGMVTQTPRFKSVSSLSWQEMVLMSKTRLV